jgi:hypothetical protein
MNVLDWLVFELIVVMIFGVFALYNRHHEHHNQMQTRAKAKLVHLRKD